VVLAPDVLGDKRLGIVHVLLMIPVRYRDICHQITLLSLSAR